MDRFAQARAPGLLPPALTRGGVRLLLIAALVVAALEWSAPAAAAQSAPAAGPPGRITLDETVISGNQELPKVLYILPWRGPEGLPEIDLQTEFSELEVFRRLYPPAYRRELQYFETLEGSTSEE